VADGAEVPGPAAIEQLEDLLGTSHKQGDARLRLITVKETGNMEIFSRLGFHVVVECEDQLFESDKHSTLTEVEMERPLDG
jgi:hypothetical protein